MYAFETVFNSKGRFLPGPSQANDEQADAATGDYPTADKEWQDIFGDIGTPAKFVPSRALPTPWVAARDVLTKLKQLPR